MKNVNIKKLLISSFTVFVTFVILEIIVEGMARFLFNISESELLRNHITVLPSGAIFQVINLGLFFVEAVIFMLILVLIRNNFESLNRALGAAIVIIMVLVFAYAVNLANLGVLPVEMVGLSFVFNLFELPLSMAAGSAVYYRGADSG